MASRWINYPFLSPVWVALIHDGLGEVDEGIEALERGIPDWGPAYVLSLAARTLWTLQSHPRFWEILRGLGYTGPRRSPPAPATAGE